MRVLARNLHPLFQRFPDECLNCGANSNLRPEGHADWCWRAHPEMRPMGNLPCDHSDRGLTGVCRLCNKFPPPNAVMTR